MFCEDPKSLFEDKKTLHSFIFQAPRAILLNGPTQNWFLARSFRSSRPHF